MRSTPFLPVSSSTLVTDPVCEKIYIPQATGLLSLIKATHEADGTPMCHRMTVSFAKQRAEIGEIPVSRYVRVRSGTPDFAGSIPVTRVTVHSGHLGNTSAKGIAIGSSRHASSSK
jgi:hypothetical protein